jgi:penicillin amidase
MLSDEIEKPERWKPRRWRFIGRRFNRPDGPPKAAAKPGGSNGGGPFAPLGASDRASSPRLKRWPRTLLVLALIAAVLVAGLKGGEHWLVGAMRDSLPVLDGEAAVPGLSSAVSVRRDGHGVPHISAASLDDLFEAQGYVTAQDRLWQMDAARRNASGNLAELLGSGFVEHDRTQRLLQMRATADRIAGSLTERDRRIYESYARGVNAFIAHNEGHLPAEFRLLRYKPAPWKPADSVLIALSMVQILDQHFDDKLSREAIEKKIGPTIAADLYPTGSWRDHPPTAPIPDLTAPQPDIPDVPLDESQSSLRDLMTLRRNVDPVAASGRTDCAQCAPGSNEWVVSGAHAASGKPMLSNDMHLGHGIPGIWYEVDLRAGTLGAGSFHVAGVSIPGAPMVVAGHNEHIAWGFTSLYGDTQDIYVERVNAQDQYLAADGWHAIAHRLETIKVRFGSDVVVDVATAGHGAVISGLVPNEKRVLTLRWTPYDPQFAGFPLFDMDSAVNWTEFRAAVSKWWGPTQNIVYADDQGHVGYQAAGAISLRTAGLSGIPIVVGAAGSAGNHEWSGYVPFDALPSSFDPANGLLATANSRITPDGYPYPLTLGWASPYRNERIWKSLAGRDKLTPADMLTLQTDVYSELNQELGQRFAYAIDHASGTDARARQAADLLRNWDGVMNVDSPAAAVVSAAKAAFWPLVLEPKLGDAWQSYDWPESSFAEEEMIMHAPAQWLPPGMKSWDELLTAAVKRGLDEGKAPADLKSWRFGSAHVVELRHPLYRLLPIFHGWTGTGKQPQSGDGSTVKQVGRFFGPSQRFTIDWSDVDSATENVVMGESGNPLSPYYRDQWPYWFGGKTFALPFSEGAVARATAHSLRLIP